MIKKMDKQNIEELIKYIENNRVDSKNLGGEYSTLKACKIASYFKPYIAWYQGDMYMKGKNLLSFRNQ